MAFKAFSKATLPAPTIGRGSTEPRVTITAQGQISFNKVASKHMVDGGHKFAAILIGDGANEGKLGVQTFKEVPAKMKEADLWALKFPGAKSKGGSVSIATGTFLSHQLKYDYKKYGNQGVGAEVNAEKGLVIFGMPVDPKPAQKRPRKAKADAPPASNVTPIAGSTEPAKTAAATAGGGDIGDDIVLES